MPRSALSVWARERKRTSPKSPICGFTSTRKMTDATATEDATVDEKIVWKTLMPRRWRLAATARTMPSTMPTGTVSRTNRIVTERPLRNSSPERTSEYWERPT